MPAQRAHLRAPVSKRRPSSALPSCGAFLSSTLRDLERGRRNPTMVTLHEIATTLEVKLVDLLRQVLTNSGAAQPSHGIQKACR